MCNTINDSSAESCTYCGYIFEGTGQVHSVSTSSVKTNEVPPNIDRQPEFSSKSSGNTTLQGSAPDIVMRSSWKDRRNLPSIIVGILLALFYVALDLPIFTGGGFSAESLVFVIIPVLLILPVFTSSRTYEFYDNSLVIHGLGSRREIPYSQLSAISNIRGRLYLQMKNQWRQIRLQGDVKSNITGQDLVSWLNQKIKPEEKGDAAQFTSEA